MFYLIGLLACAYLLSQVMMGEVAFKKDYEFPFGTLSLEFTEKVPFGVAFERKKD